MNIIELSPGAATLGDAAATPQPANRGLSFLADGVNRECSWLRAAPTELLGLSAPLYMRLFFLSSNTSPAGTARMNITYAAYDAEGLVLTAGLLNVDVVVTGPAETHYQDIDISTWLPDDTKSVLLIMFRDSSVPADTLADEITFLIGYTLA